jgi:hypothetical protein
MQMSSQLAAMRLSTSTDRTQAMPGRGRSDQYRVLPVYLSTILDLSTVFNHIRDPLYGRISNVG